MTKLRKICYHLQSQINEVISILISECKTEYDIKGIVGYVADTTRGFSHFDGQFTVPLWAYDKRYKGKGSFGEEGYFTYYVAHELAHQLRYKKYGKDGSHDYRFYEIFMDICPKQFQHFELEYKKTASKYGIGKD